MSVKTGRRLRRQAKGAEPIRGLSDKIRLVQDVIETAGMSPGVYTIRPSDTPATHAHGEQDRGVFIIGGEKHARALVLGRHDGYDRRACLVIEGMTTGPQVLQQLHKAADDVNGRLFPKARRQAGETPTGTTPGGENMAFKKVTAPQPQAPSVPAYASATIDDLQESGLGLAPVDPDAAQVPERPEWEKILTTLLSEMISDDACFVEAQQAYDKLVAETPGTSPETYGQYLATLEGRKVIETAECARKTYVRLTEYLPQAYPRVSPGRLPYARAIGNLIGMEEAALDRKALLTVLKDMGFESTESNLNTQISRLCRYDGVLRFNPETKRYALTSKKAVVHPAFQLINGTTESLVPEDKAATASGPTASQAEPPAPTATERPGPAPVPDGALSIALDLLGQLEADSAPYRELLALLNAEKDLAETLGSRITICRGSIEMYRAKLQEAEDQLREAMSEQASTETRIRDLEVRAGEASVAGEAAIKRYNEASRLVTMLRG